MKFIKYIFTILILILFLYNIYSNLLDKYNQSNNQTYKNSQTLSTKTKSISVYNNITSKKISEFPQDVRSSYVSYKNNDWQELPNIKGGGVWSNFEKSLPQGTKYKEYDLSPKTGPTRDAKRFVRGDDGVVYYTSDHYTTFIKVLE